MNHTQHAVANIRKIVCLLLIFGVALLAPPINALAAHKHTLDCFTKGSMHTHVASCGYVQNTVTSDSVAVPCTFCGGVVDLANSPRATLCTGTRLSTQQVFTDGGTYWASGYFIYTCATCGYNHGSGGSFYSSINGGSSTNADFVKDFVACNAPSIKCQGTYVADGGSGGMSGTVSYGSSYSICSSCGSRQEYAGGHSAGTDAAGNEISAGSWSYPEYNPGKPCVKTYSGTCPVCIDGTMYLKVTNCSKDTTKCYDGSTEVAPSCNRVVVGINFK